MLPVNLNDLTPEHIQGLIDSEVAESLTLEYKQQLPNKDGGDDKRSFLYDVSAMANAAGGDIVFGIAERRGENNSNTGIADKLSGERWPNVQAEMIRLSNYIKDGTAPRLTGVQMHPVTCDEGDALVIRVPSSWDRPHIVTMGKGDRFYKRSGATNNPMSVDEIRRAFSEQGELRETIARWRASRLEMLEGGRGPVAVTSGVIMLFHIIPAEAFTPGAFTETWRVSGAEKTNVYVPSGNYNQRYNADGFLCHGSLNRMETPHALRGYTQLFRSGIVEYGFSHNYQPPSGTATQAIRAQGLEQEMVYCYQDAINRLRREGRTGAVYVGFSLVGIAGKSFYISELAWMDREYEIRQNVFSSPEVYVDLSETEEKQPFPKTLLPLVDTLWQVGGREDTPFKIKGVWEPFARY